MAIRGIDDSDVSSPLELDETPTIKDVRWALDFKGAAVPAATKNPEVLKAALAARLKRIDEARDRDPWTDATDDVRSISNRVRESTANIEVPEDATHKIVGGLFADVYAKAPRVTEDGQAFYVTMVSGPRKGMTIRVDFNQLTKLDGMPDDNLKKLLGVASKGNPRAGMGANNLRKK